MNEPIDLSLFLAVASSIFLISLVSSRELSRAKTIATGFSPLRQNRHCFWPLYSPVTFIGWNGPGTFSPAWGPDLMCSAAAGMARATAATAAANRRTFITATPGIAFGPAAQTRSGDRTFTPQTLWGCGVF